MNKTEVYEAYPDLGNGTNLYLLTMNKTKEHEHEHEADPDLGNGAKFVAIAILGLGSLLAGLLPRAISFENRRRFPFLISLMLCFGAGILLATSLVHMLPEVREEMPEIAELIFCVGFFIIYLVDELVHLYFGNSCERDSNDSTTQQRSMYGSATSSESESSSRRRNSNEQPTMYGSTTNLETESLINYDNKIERIFKLGDRGNRGNRRINHIGNQEPCSETMAGTFGLLIALSLHSIIEGLAIGVQDNSKEVYLLLLAVACHKFVMSFCLGLEICSNAYSTLKSHIVSILIFSLGSVIGIGIGMALIELPDSLQTDILPVLHALAGGTLLYVTVCEIMPRERARWKHNRRIKFAGIKQFLAVGLGFAVMTIINYCFDEHHDHDHEH